MHRLQLQAAAAGKHMPLDILLAICRKDRAVLAEMDINPRDCTLLVRKSAAEACLPYLHRRMPIAVIAATEPDPAADLAERVVANLTDQELDYIAAAYQRAAAIAGGNTMDVKRISNGP